MVFPTQKHLGGRFPVRHGRDKCWHDELMGAINFMTQIQPGQRQIQLKRTNP
jgi:hypothetical protein